MTPLEPIKEIEIHGWLPDEQFADVIVNVWGKTSHHRVGGGGFVVSCATDADASGDVTLRVSTKRLEPRATTDARPLGFVLSRIVVRGQQFRQGQW